MEQSVPHVIKLSHLKYADDNNRKECELPLDERFAPRVDSIEIMSVLGYEVNELLLERKDITLSRKCAAMAHRPGTPGKENFLFDIIDLLVFAVLGL